MKNSEPCPGAGRDRSRQLARAFRRLGLEDDVEGWVESELEEDIPQLARYRFLSQLWPRMIDSWRSRIDAEPVARGLVASGADRDELVQLARTVAYDTVFAMLYHLDDDGRADAVDLPSWALVEVTGGAPTGRRLSALFEDLLSLDPSGEDGDDLIPPPPGPWLDHDEPR